MDPKLRKQLVGLDPVPFTDLISTLTTSTGSARSHAESLFYSLCQTNPNSVSIKLLLLLQFSSRSEIRAEAASLLRNLLTRASNPYYLWHRLHPLTQCHLKEDLLTALRNEHKRSVLGHLRGGVVELGSDLLCDDSWPELIFFMFEAMVSSSPRVQESGLLIFSYLAECIETSSLPPLTTLRSILILALTDTNSSTGGELDVKIAALLASISLIHCTPSKDREKLQDLLPPLVFVLVEACTGNREEDAKEAVKMLAVLIEIEPIFFCWPELVDTMLKIAEFDELEEELRREAVNLVVTIAKTGEKEPVMVEQLVPFLGRFLAILLQMLSDIEDDEAWYTAHPDDEDKDTDEMHNFKFSKESSYAISAALGGALLVPVVIELLPAYLENADWKKRHAALIFLKGIAEGCSEALKDNLEQFVNTMVNSFNDIHLRVRGAALNVTCELLVVPETHVASKYHDRIFPALLHSMNTYDCPRVQVEATRAAWNFICSCNKDVLKIYLQDLLGQLHMMILAGNTVVQDEALLALESLAYLLEDTLESYYEYVMRWLKALLRDAIHNADRMLCAKLLQCISIVGAVLGKSHFRNDAQEVMEELMSFRAAPLEEDDPVTGYMLQLWMKLLKCLGRDFLPFMDLVMPPLFQYAQSESDLIISSTNMDNIEVKMAEGAGEKLRTKFRLLDEKASACDMLCCYADELKEDFFPWIDKAAPLLLPFLKFNFHKEVRKTAISAMSKILYSAKLAVEKHMPDDPEEQCLKVKQLCSRLIPSIIEALHEEHDTELCGEMLGCLTDCIQLLEELEEDQVIGIVKELKNLIVRSIFRTGKELRDVNYKQDALLLNQIAECLVMLSLESSRDLLFASWVKETKAEKTIPRAREQLQEFTFRQIRRAIMCVP
ncbi:ARM repeat superfamily protein [Rhynchospora pubera]|uniref:ARM repeat superfamily protein n=1 Tax=Rhynchospora pubera TaxID=906938 RepID=A0AAV8D2C4_9POAL|nr:ARM repeat superfamily protein [Rhynchospora pubera]